MKTNFVLFIIFVLFLGCSSSRQIEIGRNKLRTNIPECPNTMVQKKEKRANGIRNSCVDQTGEEQGPFWVTYNNGKLKVVGQKINGRKNGVWKEYTEKGALLNETRYRRGLKNGTEIEYNDASGTKLISTEYKQGIKDGLEVFYNSEEQPIIVRFYIDGFLRKKIIFERLPQHKIFFVTILIYTPIILPEFDLSFIWIEKTMFRNQKKIDFTIELE